MGRTRARYRDANGYMNMDQHTGSGSLPLAHSPLHTKVTRGARPTLPHKPTTPVVVVRTDDLTHEFILARQWMHLIMGAVSLWTRSPALYL